MEYLGHLFTVSNKRARSGAYYICSKCSILLFNGEIIKLKFCNKFGQGIESISCNEF